jgi:hypothetical protein
MGPWMKDNFHPSFQPINGIVRNWCTQANPRSLSASLALNYSMHLLQYAARRTSGSGGMSTFEDSTGALYSRDGRSTGWLDLSKDNYNTESLWREAIYRRSSWSSRIDAIG